MYAYLKKYSGNNLIGNERSTLTAFYVNNVGKLSNNAYKINKRVLIYIESPGVVFLKLAKPDRPALH